METLHDLLKTLKSINIDNIEEYIDSSSISGQIYEGCWKIVFNTRTYVIDKEYVMLKGRTENNTIDYIKNPIKYLKETNINNGSADGILDIKLETKTKNKDKYIFMSSKYYKKLSNGSHHGTEKYDVAEIKLKADNNIKYKDKYYIWLLVRDKNEIKQTIGNQTYFKNIDKILDINDLKICLKELQFKLRNKSLKEIILYNLQNFFLRQMDYIFC